MVATGHFVAEHEDSVICLKADARNRIELSQTHRCA